MEDQNLENQDLKAMAEEEEISLSDKLLGVFTEPGRLFKDLSTKAPKTSDWLVPLSLIIVVVLLIQLVVFVRPSLKDQAISKQMVQVEKRLDEAVADGRISQETADAQYDQTYDALNNQMGKIMIINAIVIVAFSLIFFFIASGFFIGIAKFVLKGDGSYKMGLSAYGLPLYISVLQLIVNILLIVAMDSIEIGTNLTKIAGWDIKEFSGYLASFVDPFSIWFYSILGLSFAKMFKSESTGKYIAAFISAWVVVGVIFYFIAQQVPVLQNLIQ